MLASQSKDLNQNLLKRDNREARHYYLLSSAVHICTPIICKILATHMWMFNATLTKSTPNRTGRSTSSIMDSDLTYLADHYLHTWHPIKLPLRSLTLKLNRPAAARQTLFFLFVCITEYGVVMYIFAGSKTWTYTHKPFAIRSLANSVSALLFVK